MNELENEISIISKEIRYALACDDLDKAKILLETLAHLEKAYEISRK